MFIFIFYFLFLTSCIRFPLRYQAENVKVKVLKAYQITGFFFYDVRSVHSWGLPRRKIPEDRLKGNAAGFSAFGSLEILGNRTKINRKEEEVGVIWLLEYQVGDTALLEANTKGRGCDFIFLRIRILLILIILLQIS